ncbi:hypothetical protein A2765_05160 [Candidatus Kaiserbacteria bacterium RIFCSPHIGHO2_01_FULL_56_24]|uniref:Orc1-like AAA ATPase domain-containing protein n=1 Tax=Candidatus Kaiserbacteria bacterium RIFCSPHIGHO2_01_FULL_56_24 TaxID=1798487 RepID=A0A1F6D9W4_9BACT|nr:MAG: hypothetical protein A2765_05160 [Candidatus Kaiserbacteria bacterium RIFCSPHIGHO2_01_FULL_56_24]
MTNSSSKASLLEGLSFGQRVAEQEPKLEEYFVETLIWRKILRGEVDIVYGMKGSGKSAIFHLLSTGRAVPQNVKIIPAEDTRGDPVFSAIKQDPPTSEIQFVYLWKLYILSLIASDPQILEILKRDHSELVEQLSSVGVIGDDKARILSRVLKYVDSVSVSTVEIKLKDPGESKKSIDVDEVLKLLNSILKQNGKIVWILFDRLDAVFDYNTELEQNALRALFRVYQDSAKYDSIRLKIFLRKDIWKSLTEKGMREGSHITLSDSIEWSEPNIVNLIVRRLLSNPEIVSAFNVDSQSVLNNYELQKDFFYRVFPKQIDAGSRKSETIRWLMARVSDGTQKIAPRELIHLLNEAKDGQINAMELGEAAPPGENLFTPTAIKNALPPVSQARMEQTIFAEYPDLKKFILMLEGEKATQSIESLMKIWDMSIEDAVDMASRLVDIGFFETRGDKRNPEFRVPFLYRPYLKLIQGKADEE